MKFNEIPLGLYYSGRIIKLEGIEYTEKMLDWMFENGVKYILKWKTLYQLMYSSNYEPHYYLIKIFTFSEPKTMRGRHWDLTAKEVNVSHSKDGVPELQ